MVKLDETIIKKYAQVMVQYALNNGKALIKGILFFWWHRNAAKIST